MIITPIRLGAWNRAVGQIASCRLLLAAHSPVKGENMAMKIFVNLPVKNLNRSVEFFSKLGFSFDKQYTDETATCMVVSEEIFVMLLTEEKFRPLLRNRFATRLNLPKCCCAYLWRAVRK
jgi:hypothetical protein